MRFLQIVLCPVPLRFLAAPSLVRHRGGRPIGPLCAGAHEMFILPCAGRRQRIPPGDTRIPFSGGPRQPGACGGNLGCVRDQCAPLMRQAWHGRKGRPAGGARRNFSPCGQAGTPPKHGASSSASASNPSASRRGQGGSLGSAPGGGARPSARRHRLVRCADWAAVFLPCRCP